MRAIASVGTLLVALSVAVGNYFSRIMYEGVTNGFDEQPTLMWALPFMGLGSLLLLGLVALAIYLCRKGIFVKTIKSCCRAKRGARI